MAEEFRGIDSGASVDINTIKGPLLPGSFQQGGTDEH
jgi:hypothetical protein